MTTHQLIFLARSHKYPSTHHRPLGAISFVVELTRGSSVVPWLPPPSPKTGIQGISELDGLHCKSKYECEWLTVLLRFSPTMTWRLLQSVVCLSAKGSWIKIQLPKCGVQR